MKCKIELQLGLGLNTNKENKNKNKKIDIYLPQSMKSNTGTQIIIQNEIFFDICKFKIHDFFIFKSYFLLDRWVLSFWTQRTGWVWQ